MYQVRKRSGELELFELAKVKSAIQRTFESCERSYQPSIIEIISIKSIALAEKKVKDSILSVEDIQDSVETTLMNLGYEDVAKAYILYRKQHERNRNAKNQSRLLLFISIGHPLLSYRIWCYIKSGRIL